MLDFRTLERLWKEMTYYERFEQLASRIVMVLISALIVYLLIFVAINLFDQFKQGVAFADVEALKDVFGSILTVLILIEFNHSIALAISKRSGVLQVRFIVLIAILVIARKVILLDFSTATFEQLIGISGIAIAFGLLYWLISLRSSDLFPRRETDRSGEADA
ncbi:MAG TPA: phosphate-starvation-inducible PsiE family protein [Xanthobacteraceae bacterium]